MGWIAPLLVVAGCTGRARSGTIVTTVRGALSSDASAGISWISTEFLGRPTASSVTLQAIAGQSVDAYVEYGTSSGSYPLTTNTATFSDGFVQILIGSLTPDTAYVYRLLYRSGGSSDDFVAGDEHSFHTQRARGQTFSFAIQADSHQGFAAFYNDALYRTTLQNILAEGDDFMLDLGDTFSLDDATETAETVAQKYVNQLAVFDLAAHSTPVFLVLGNHERETGWELATHGSDVADTLPVLNANARKQYFLNPIPDSFYSGDTDISGGGAYISGDQLRGDYYAFEWGDALFVAIEPYWYTTKKPYMGTPGGDLSDAAVGTRWDWTLGQQQYQWLQQTLANSTATYKFVFAHHEAGGIDDYGRGGALGAKYCEWGGYDIDGETWAFDTNRPGWAMPVHQLLVQNQVTVFFHAHDHVYAKETLDGVVYQEMPMAANANYDTGFSTNPTDYAGTTLIPNSGHLRVTVSPNSTTVAYVRSFLPGNGTNGSIAATYVLCAGANLDAGETNPCQGGSDAGAGGVEGSTGMGTDGGSAGAGGASGAATAGNSGKGGSGARGGLGGKGGAKGRGAGGIGGASGTTGGGGISGITAGVSGTDAAAAIGPSPPAPLTPPVPLTPTPAGAPTISGGDAVSGGATQSSGSGCGCETGPSPTGGPGLLLLVGTLTVVARRRRHHVRAGATRARRD